jgi:hypothetical protein
MIRYHGRCARRGPPPPPDISRSYMPHTAMAHTHTHTNPTISCAVHSRCAP